MKKTFNYRELLGPENPLLRFPLLYDAAVDEFSQKKFAEASLNDILRKAEMSKGSLYHHFGDKFGLYLAVMDRIAVKKLEFFQPLIQKGVDVADFFATILSIARETMAFMFQDERMYHLTNRLLEEGPEWISKLIEYFHYDFTSGFGALVDAAAASGQIDSRYPPELVTKVLEILLTNLHKLTPGKTPEEAVQLLEQTMGIMQYGLNKR